MILWLNGARSKMRLPQIQELALMGTQSQSEQKSAETQSGLVDEQLLPLNDTASTINAAVESHHGSGYSWEGSRSPAVELRSKRYEVP